ncbi:hypothetical protein EVAR_68667_1 [Eumeta japonica]|uniref:Uncharacterized protein n=1 Tax=Eumeta variegata TaxID=151549 RepID=A0A4C2A2V5_EUMVA|nr:hypothetical protein EVAR_68667_1 [Eumeta japonica]
MGRTRRILKVRRQFKTLDAGYGLGAGVEIECLQPQDHGRVQLQSREFDTTRSNNALMDGPLYRNLHKLHSECVDYINMSVAASDAGVDSARARHVTRIQSYVGCYCWGLASHDLFLRARSCPGQAALRATNDHSRQGGNTPAR